MVAIYPMFEAVISGAHIRCLGCLQLVGCMHVIPRVITLCRACITLYHVSYDSIHIHSCLSMPCRFNNASCMHGSMV